MSNRVPLLATIVATAVAVLGAVALWVESFGPLTHLLWWLIKFQGEEAINIGRTSLFMVGGGGSVLALIGFGAARAAATPPVCRHLARRAGVALVLGVTLWVVLAATPWVDVAPR